MASMTEPAWTNLDRFLDVDAIQCETPMKDAQRIRAQEMLGESDVNGDVVLIGAVLAHVECDEAVAVVSDDRRVRTMARGLDARVTGTIGVLVRAVAEGLPADEGRELVRRVDAQGLHLTGELRDRAFELIDEAAVSRSE